MSSGFSRERLAFNLGPETVPGRGRIEAAIRDSEPTFATAEYAEPRDWGYVGLLAFTAVMLLRPQDTFQALTSVHVAEICAIIGIGPMLLHRFARRLPVFRVTPEIWGRKLMVFPPSPLRSSLITHGPGTYANSKTSSSEH